MDQEGEAGGGMATGVGGMPLLYRFHILEGVLPGARPILPKPIDDRLSPEQRGILFDWARAYSSALTTPVQAEPVGEISSDSTDAKSSERQQRLDAKYAWMRDRQAKLNGAPMVGRPTSKEEPLTVNAASAMWGQSPKATRRYFKGLEGVRVIAKPSRYDRSQERWVRPYDTVLIPPSVLEREIRKVTKAS